MKHLTYYLSAFAVMLCLTTSCSDDDDPKPKSIEVTAETTEHTAKITFSEIDGALGYNVDYAEKGEELEYAFSIATLDDLSTELKELKAGTEYTVKLTAFNLDKDLGEGTVDFTTEEVLESLVGTWIYSYDNNSITYVFNKDGFGTYKTSSTDENEIMWSAVEKELTIRKYFNEVGDRSQEQTLTYSIAEDGGTVTIDQVIYFAKK